MKIILDKILHILKRDQAIVWLLVTVGILIYLNSLPNEMFWDDDDFILKNVNIQDWRHFPTLFTDNIISGTHLISNYWRPLLLMVFSVEWHLWANWVYGWHTVNTAFHIADSVLLFFLINLIFQRRWLAILTALVFLVHPLQTEAVVYVNSLGDSLSTFFVFLGLLFYTRFRRSNSNAIKSPDYGLALLMYPLALLSKELGILLVAYAAICDYMLQDERKSFRQKIATIATALWPFIAIAIGYMLLRATVLNFHNSFNFYSEPTAFTSNGHIRIFTFFRVLALYAGFIFIPYDLRVERLIDPATTFFAPDVMWGAAIFTLMIFLAIRYWKKTPLITFGILWFLIGISPTCNLFVIINAFVYEHWLYVPLVGVSIVVINGGLELAKNPKWTKPLIILTIIMLSAFSIRSVWRNNDWRTAIGFYERLLPAAGKSYRVLNNLGMEYAEKGFPDKAGITYKKAIALDPTNAVAYHNMGNLSRDAGRPDEAIQYFEKAIARQRNFVFSYPSLAQLYVDKKEYVKARNVLEGFYSLTEDKYATLRDLTQVALREKNYAVAKNYFLVMLKMNPNDPEILSTIRKLDQILSKP